MKLIWKDVSSYLHITAVVTIMLFISQAYSWVYKADI